MQNANSKKAKPYNTGSVMDGAPQNLSDLKKAKNEIRATNIS